MDEIQKELRVRTRVMSIYNKLQEDFASKQEWDDYLEQIEDIIYNLVNRIDEKVTEARVQDYERANRLNIIANQARLADRLKKAQLESSKADAAEEQEAAATGMGAAPAPVSFQQPQTLLAAQPQPLVAPVLDAEGRLPAPRPSSSRFEAMAAASGWSQDLPRSRALQEAFSSLLVF